MQLLERKDYCNFSPPMGSGLLLLPRGSFYCCLVLLVLVVAVSGTTNLSLHFQRLEPTILSAAGSPVGRGGIISRYPEPRSVQGTRDR